MSRWSTFTPLFKGRLVVLAGGDTFSGGAELASMLYHTHRAVFVGEEVGGADQGNTSGYRWTLVLPNSGMKLTCLCCNFAWRGQVGPQSRGVQPDCFGAA
jgi:C-terminal processing protease CtpA/Prc